MKLVWKFKWSGSTVVFESFREWIAVMKDFFWTEPLSEIVRGKPIGWPALMREQKYLALKEHQGW